MKCERVRTRLSAYIDGEIDAGLHREIADHLEQCPGCREELEESSRVDGLVGGLPRFDLPADFARVVVSRVQNTDWGAQRGHFLHRAWKALIEYSERFFDLLEPEPRVGTRSLDEFNDIPASFIGHAYFKVLGLQR